MTPQIKQEEFSVAYLHAVASVVGCTVLPPSQDEDSIDRTLSIKTNGATFSSVKIDVQLKCHMVDAIPTEDNFSYALSKKNYDELRRPDVMAPRILVLLLVPKNMEQWLLIEPEQLIAKYSAYWLNLKGLPESPNNTSVTLSMPKSNIFTVDCLKAIVQNIADGKNL